MPTSSRRRNNGVRKTTSENRRSQQLRHHIASISDLRKQCRQLNEIANSADIVIENMLSKAIKYRKDIDEPYVSKTIASARRSVDSIRNRVEERATRLEKMAMQAQCGADLTGEFMEMLDDISDERQFIDTGIYSPLQDVAREFNAKLSNAPDAHVDLDEIQDIINSLI